MRRTFVLSTCLIFIMAFAASPVLADSMVSTSLLGLEDTDPGDKIIDSISCDGTDYSAASDLITGTTTQYNSSDQVVTSYQSADNFNFQSDDLISFDSASYSYTIFGQMVDKVFVVADRGDSASAPPESGSIWSITGLDSGGMANAFGSKVSFGASDWLSTGELGGWGGDRPIFLMAFEPTNPVHGVKIDPDGGLEICSISGAPVPIPGAIWLLGSGVLGLLAFRRRGRN